MEHLLFLIIEFVLWLDRRSLKPLNKLVPNLSELRSKPAAVLSEGDLTIGPQRRWGSGVALGLLLGLGILLAGLLVLVLANAGRPRVRPGPASTMFLVLVLLGAPLFSVVFMLHLFKGGRVVLRAAGVEFHDRGTTVVCPWSLFSAPGLPFQPAKDRILLPANPAAAALVEAHRDDRLLAHGVHARSRAFRFKHPNLVELRALYQAELPELAELLLHLGRQLAAPLPRRAAEHPAAAQPVETAPPLLRKADGWIKASLVHLSFPPYCCDCGTYTPERKEYQGFSFGLRVGQVDFLPAGDFARVEVPVCAACQAEDARVRRQSVLVGSGIGVLFALVLGASLCVMANNPLLFFMALPLAIFGIVIGATAGHSVGKTKTSPVQLRAYAPSEGTILLWFRNPAYGDALMELLGGVTEKAPEEANALGNAYSER